MIYFGNEVQAMTTHKSIFYQAQEQVCEALNNDEVLSGKVTFIPENSKDIDYEIKNAMGRQGIVGVVMTPEATYQGVTDNGEQVWDLRDFTVQVVENPIVNRGQPNYANITALDAAARASDILAGPEHGLFGQYCPNTIEQGEDEGLIVAQCKFNVQVKAENTEPYTYIHYADGSASRLKIEGELGFGSIPNVADATSVQIGNKVTSIGGTAFSDCGELKSVTIPNSVTSIGDSAFLGCTGLTNVVIPDSVTSLGASAFDSCFNLTSVTIGNGVTSIGNYAFFDCERLTSVVIPDSVTSIGEYAFQFCEGFTTMTIPDSVTSIGNYAFGACNKLTSLTIGSGVTSIGQGALGGCFSLMDVTFSGKDKATVQGMANHYWDLIPGCVIHCTDGDITL